ncbi:MAG: WD40/YVTN/BNR-like repeat-containing protein, partial [Candidatus Aminicenantales bacterium]
MILKTTNGGLNWTKIHTLPWMELLDIYFVDRNQGWVVGGEFAISLIEPGETWNPIEVKNPNGRITGFYFVDDREGWVVGDHGFIVHTTDGRITLESQGITLKGFPPSVWILSSRQNFLNLSKW